LDKFSLGVVVLLLPERLHNHGVLVDLVLQLVEVVLVLDVDLLDLMVELRELLLLRLELVGGEGADDVLDLRLVLEGIVSEVPVVHDKPEVILHFHHLGHFVPCGEGVAHDCDQHSQKDHQHVGGCPNEKNV